MSTQVALTSLSKRFHFTPTASLPGNKRSANAPKLIFLFAWMGAKIPHVQKYVNGYTAIWPATPIVLVQSLPQDFRPFSKYASEYGPLKTLLAQYDIDLTKDSDANEVMMVTMSNGGCWSAQAFLSTLPTGAVIRARALIHDSCPGLPRYRRTLTAFLIAGKYRLFSKAIATVVITIYYLISKVFNSLVGRDPVGEMRALMLERIRPARRTYIYSPQDAIIDHRDVESHADAAKAHEEGGGGGGGRVMLELFEGSSHVMHLLSDEKRYWKVIQEAWNAGAHKADVIAPDGLSEKPTIESVSSLDDSYINASASTLAPTEQADIKVATLNEEDSASNSDLEELAGNGEVGSGDLNPSVLGTKDYWDQVYKRECKNFEETADEGEIWFGEESEDKIIRYIKAHYPLPPSSFTPSSTRVRNNNNNKQAPPMPNIKVLDLGTGNGHLLFSIAEAGFAHWDMTGIDYSAHSITLARSIASTRKLSNISFSVQDFLDPSAATGRGDAGHEVYDLILDKGTFDAISLASSSSKDTAAAVAGDTVEKLWHRYAPSVAARLKSDGGRLIVTSCNWTREELVTRLTRDGALKVHAYFQEPKRTFQFGGKQGSTTSQVVFRRAAPK